MAATSVGLLAQSAAVGQPIVTELVRREERGGGARCEYGVGNPHILVAHELVVVLRLEHVDLAVADIGGGNEQRGSRDVAEQRGAKLLLEHGLEQ